MREVDFAEVVQGMIAEELARRLEPYRTLLERLDKARRAVPLRAGPGRPRRADLEALRRLLQGKTPARKPIATIKPGAVVHYRQGRGSFEASVIRTEADGAVVLERVSDGKRVKRPAEKLF